MRSLGFLNVFSAVLWSVWRERPVFVATLITHQTSAQMCVIGPAK